MLNVYILERGIYERIRQDGRIAFEGVMPDTGEVGIFVITRDYDYFYPYDENMC